MSDDARARLRAIELALALDELDVPLRANPALAEARNDGLVIERDGRVEYSPEYWALDAVAESHGGRGVPVALSSLNGSDAAPFPAHAFAGLQAAANRWKRVRLWDGNLVPELVVHDDRHAEHVDHLAAYLSLPLLLGPVPLLSPTHAVILATASWLHDWGHVGGLVRRTLTGVDQYVSVSEPQDVRRMHGIVSQELLDNKWRGMHWVPLEIGPWAGLLAGHHQSWTSFGGELPGYRTVGGVDVRPQTFAQDYDRIRRAVGPRSPAFGVVQRLLALLRIADALDVGSHRVPDYGPHKESFLARSIQTHAWRALRRAAASGSSAEAILSFRTVVAEISLHAREWAEQAATSSNWRAWEPVKDEMLASLRDPSIAGMPEGQSLSDYITFVGTTQSHYALHHSVGSVHLRMGRDERGKGRPGVVVDILVRLRKSAGLSARDVLRTLRKDFIEKELGQGDGDQTVGRVLSDAGVRFGEIVNYSTGEPGEAVPVTTVTA